MPPWVLAVASMLSVQLGSALSVPLIATVGAAGTAWLRLSMGALVFLALARPPLRALRLGDLPALLGLGVTTGLLPVLPFAFEMLALRRMPSTAFGTLMALEPAIGVLLGLVVLHQRPSPGQLLGILLVVLAGTAAQRDGRIGPGAP